MNTTQLTNTDLTVSKIALGTMLFGSRNTEAESHAMCDAAWNRGVNFFDTAEFYSVPPRAETHGLSEQILGKWARNKGRDKVIIATKKTGVNNFEWIRNGDSRYTRAQILAAIEDSLRRLDTDYIDLYQLHWPDRNASFFHTNFDPKIEPWFEKAGNAPALEILDALNEAKKQGKIRYFGVSNETSWGVCNYQNTAKAAGLSGISTIQNGYSLLNREFERELYETCWREQVSLLAYSPLSFGTLTNKYAHTTSHLVRKNDAKMVEGSPRYFTEHAMQASQVYADIADQAGISATELALSYVYSRPFVASTIIGASTLAQLEYNLDVSDNLISVDLEVEINRAYLRHGDAARHVDSRLY